MKLYITKNPAPASHNNTPSQKGEPLLRSVRPAPEQPTSASKMTAAPAANRAIKTAKKSELPRGIRSLEQKIKEFNTKPDSRILASTLKVDSFNLDTFASNFIERRKAFKAGKSGYTQVNFSGSILESGTLHELYHSQPSRINEPDSFWDWPVIFPKNLPQQHRQRLDELKARFDSASDESASVARQELNNARLEILQDYPKILYRLPRISIGYIVGDGADIHHAFPEAGNTFNQRHHVVIQSEGLKPKSVAHSDTYQNEKKRDKHFKINKKKVKARGHHETLDALSRHVKKHKLTQCTEILFGAPDKKLSHIVDGFFLDMRSGFEKMDLETVNLYLYYNREEVQQKLQQIKGFPLLVNYTDKTSGLHKFAYITLDAAGIPVAMETRPDAAEQSPDDKKPRSSLRALLSRVSAKPLDHLASSISQRFSGFRSHRTA